MWARVEPVMHPRTMIHSVWWMVVGGGLSFWEERKIWERDCDVVVVVEVRLGMVK